MAPHADTWHASQTAINTAEYVGLAIVVVVIICRAVDNNNTFLRHDYLWCINVAVGGLCLVTLTTMACVYANRALKAYRWRHPQKCHCRSGHGCT